MRLRALAACLLLLVSVSGCGAADTAAPSLPPTGTPATQSQPASAPTDALPTLRPTPTEVPAMQDKPTPESLPPAPTAPPTPTRRFSQSTPIGPPESAEPAPTPEHSAVVAPPLSPALTAMVDTSRADLARRQSAAIEDVALVEVRTVVWPDGGLGCPRPGMVYPQVQVDGLLIRLRIGEQTFDYHTDGQKPPFLCEQKRRAAPLAPAPDAPIAPAPVTPVDLAPPPGNP